MRVLTATSGLQQLLQREDREQIPAQVNHPEKPLGHVGDRVDVWLHHHFAVGFRFDQKAQLAHPEPKTGVGHGGSLPQADGNVGLRLQATQGGTGVEPTLTGVCDLTLHWLSCPLAMPAGCDASAFYNALI
jgi:hypothetical protein